MASAWRTSSYTSADGGSCVETAADSSGVLVRDTKDREGRTLAIPAPAWHRLLADIRASGEFSR